MEEDRRGGRECQGFPSHLSRGPIKSVRWVNPAPLLALPASCIFAEPLISLVIFKMGPPPRPPPQIRGRRGPLQCVACLNLQKLVLRFLLFVKGGRKD